MPVASAGRWAAGRWQVRDRSWPRAASGQPVASGGRRVAIRHTRSRTRAVAAPSGFGAGNETQSHQVDQIRGKNMFEVSDYLDQNKIRGAGNEVLLCTHTPSRPRARTPSRPRTLALVRLRASAPSCPHARARPRAPSFTLTPVPSPLDSLRPSGGGTQPNRRPSSQCHYVRTDR